ncbi:MAG TPA: nucleoside monophosphate kinase [Candidatus Paceibacterota bacterium]|nr:nucleoside monophosphate kinase [Candidatus Paceibacterota bacterium]
MIQQRIAVALYAPPGGGKGTQANLLADKLGLIHFDTGRFLESVVHDPKRQKEAVIRRERKNFDTGRLVTPSFTLREVKKEVKMLAAAGWGVVFSGSPRTMYEAEGLIPLLEKLYGRKKMFFIQLDVDSKHSMERNSARLLCKICHAPLLTKYYPSKNPKHCPVCGGPFYRRTLDNPKVIVVRLKEYAERTKPIFAYLKKLKYPIMKVDGRPEPYKVFENVLRHLKPALK